MLLIALNELGFNKTAHLIIYIMRIPQKLDGLFKKAI